MNSLLYYICITENDKTKEIMKATLTIENENATAFEQFLEETFEGAQTFRIRERDFHTDFIFEDQTTEEIEFLDELENDFKNGIRQIQH